MSEKKVWKEPELVILVRNHPEEAILLGCKSNTVPNASGDGYGNVNRWCIRQSAGSCFAVYCEGPTAS